MCATVVIHGPQGCGKTRRAQALARHFGCERIVDDWDGVSELQPDVLALTSADSIRPLPDSRVIAFDVAEMSLQWSATPDPTHDCAALSDPQPAQSLQQDLWLLYKWWCRRQRQRAAQGPQGIAKTAAQGPAALSVPVPESPGTTVDSRIRSWTAPMQGDDSIDMGLRGMSEVLEELPPEVRQKIQRWLISLLFPLPGGPEGAGALGEVGQHGTCSGVETGVCGCCGQQLPEKREVDMRGSGDRDHQVTKHGLDCVEDFGSVGGHGDLR
jgi:hypothetical protein